MGQALGNFAQSSIYKGKAAVARAEGRVAQIAAQKKAANLEEEARADSHIAAKNMMRQRENQTDAKEAVRNALSQSGFTSEGSGSQAALATADIFETAIRDAALSNAISDLNKRHAADVSRHQGNMSAMQGNMEAQQLEGLAKNARVAGFIQLGSTAAAAGGAWLGNYLSDTPAQIPMTDDSGNAIIGKDGKPIMVANPDYLSPVAFGKATYDLTGTALTAMPGSVNTTGGNGGGYIYQLLSRVLGEKAATTPQT